MPRSSRHKSSKHSSRDSKDYSDSERESGLKEEKNTKEKSKPGSGEKRKLDSKDTSKDVWISGNGDYLEEYSSSKRRREKVDDGASDRWNGNEDDGKGEKKSRTSSESKSKRREDAEGDDTKRSRSEGRYRESSRREEREREKKGKEGKCYRPIESEEHRPVRQSAERNDQLKSPESESQLDRRFRKRTNASGDGDKCLEDNGDLDGQFSVSNGTGKDGRVKDEKHKDETYKDKYQEDMDCEDKWQGDKLRDDPSASEHGNCKSSEKHLRDGKDDVKARQKSKTQDCDFECDRVHDKERDRERYRERDMGREHERYRDHYRERDRYRDHDYDRDYDSQWDRDRERDRRNSDRDKDRDCDRVEHDERRSARYKDSKGRKRSPDDGTDTKCRGAKVHYSDMENKSISGRLEGDADRGRSQSRPANLDAVMGSSRRRASPSSSSHGGTDGYRHLKQDDLNYRDPMTEQAASSREVTNFSKTSERGARYRSTEKSSRVDEGHYGEFERSSSLKVSPVSRSGVRRGIDIDETGWSSASVGGREEDNRLCRDLHPEKLLLDGSSQADSVFYNRAGQGSLSLNPQPSGLRTRVGSPSFTGSPEEDNRFNNSGRYKRSGDLNVRRGHANAWRGAPNWPPPVPNGFIPFQPGPPHGGFQAMTPQFPSPSLFGVRPSMEVDHSGIAYHIPDAERFNNHMRPMRWQNTMDGSVPAHFHGHNVIFRDEAHMFRSSEWDQNRHPVNGRGWDTSSGVWKGQNAHVDIPSTSQKEDHPLQAPLDDVYDGQDCQRSRYKTDSDGVQVKGLETRSDVMSPVKESSRISPEIPHNAPDSSKTSSEDHDARFCQVYLSKLDISAKLAGSELYDQCMGLLNAEKSKDLAKDVKMLVKLKRTISANASIPVSSPSLIPTTNASVFQKAMAIYKKQRLQMGAIPIVNDGMFAFTSASKEKGKEQSSDHVVGEAEEPVSMLDSEMMPDSVQQKAEAVPIATSVENVEQLASMQGELPYHLNSLSPEKSEQPNTVFGRINIEVPEPKPVSDGDKAEERECEQMNSGDVVGGSVRSLDGENSNDINKTEGNSSVYCANERETFGDAVSCPLNDSPKELENQIPDQLSRHPCICSISVDVVNPIRSPLVFGKGYSRPMNLPANSKVQT
ncbi:zinc finger CCCH domain-containing protein 13-like [Hibiscus syriacus]|uniref:zinc finger CCCH domain-containing protein 13-like n=1 Tax=Hibiscus syriacus TaxID=106335 RepID=UPI0019238D43|nr:zinc finger CCCH domain-containing protein 13-like [Hibiscus syriacus]